MFFKTYDTEFDEIMIKLMAQNRRPLKTGDKVNLTLLISFCFFFFFDRNGSEVEDCRTQLCYIKVLDFKRINVKEKVIKIITREKVHFVLLCYGSNKIFSWQEKIS